MEEKTVKLRAYSDDIKNPSAPIDPADEKSLDLAMKDAQIEEERSRSLEHLKTIVQLRESLKQEQARTVEVSRKVAELEAKVRGSTEQEANELAKKNAQLEEEKGRSQEQLKMIVQLRESLKQEQAKVAGMTDRLAALEARAGDVAALEARLGELTGALGKIATIATAVKPD
jgi:chromosome segregation ATPase